MQKLYNPPDVILQSKIKKAQETNFVNGSKDV
jgi:hypothetical protein